MATPVVAMPASGLEILLNHEIPREHHGILASILNESWGWLIEATPELIAQRIGSGFPIIVSYDAKKPGDEIPGVDIMPHGKVPVVILEAIAILTGGQLDKIPKTYAELTGKGTWFRDFDGNYDTLLMVDLTAIPSRRGKNGNGEVEEVVHFARELLKGRLDYGLSFDPRQIRNIATYSPAIEGVVHMHERFGAVNSHYRIKGARDPIRNGLRGLTGEQFRQIHPDHNPLLDDANINVYDGFGIVINSGL